MTATALQPTRSFQPRRASRWLALGAAGAVAARMGLGALGVAQVVPGTAGSLFLGQHAYSLVFLAAFVEGTAVLGLLIPGAGVVALSGAGARDAGVSAASLPLLVTLGAGGLLVAAVANYHLGRAGLIPLLRQPWLGAWGPRVADQLTAAAPLLRRHGWWVALLASTFGAARSSLAVAAGAGGLSLPRLLAIQLPAALVWSALYAGGGYLLADQWEAVAESVRRAGVAGIAATMSVALVAWGIRRRRRAALRVRARGSVVGRPPV